MRERERERMEGERKKERKVKKKKGWGEEKKNTTTSFIELTQVLEIFFLTLLSKRKTCFSNSYY
jgi:hypothetical protein